MKWIRIWKRGKKRWVVTEYRFKLGPWKGKGKILNWSTGCWCEVLGMRGGCGGVLSVLYFCIIWMYILKVLYTLCSFVNGFKTDVRTAHGRWCRNVGEWVTAMAGTYAGPGLMTRIYLFKIWYAYLKCIHKVHTYMNDGELVGAVTV